MNRNQSDPFILISYSNFEKCLNFKEFKGRLNMQSLDHFKEISKFKICRYELRNLILSYDLKCFQKYSERKLFPFKQKTILI